MVELNSYLKQIREGTLNKPTLNVKVKTDFTALASHAFRQVSGNLESLTHEMKDVFCSDYSIAWADMLSNLATWEDRTINLELPRNDHVLFIGWQFPELPLVFSIALEKQILVTVSQDVPWLKKLRLAGCTINYRTRNGLRELASQMRAGRIVGTAMDHIYFNTGTVLAPFLGRQVRIPSHIIKLCISNRYTLAFLGPRYGGISIVNSLESSGHGISDVAAWVNKCLEKEVKRAPDRWLMWPSLSYRFLDAA